MTSETNKQGSESAKVQTHHKKQHDSLSRIFFGVIIIWLGISFLLVNQNYYYWFDWWAYFLLGLGIIFLIEAVIYLVRPELSRSYMGNLIAGVVLTALGAINIYGMSEWWPMILVIVGIIIILVSVQKKTVVKSEPQE